MSGQARRSNEVLAFRIVVSTYLVSVRELNPCLSRLAPRTTWAKIK